MDFLPSDFLGSFSAKSRRPVFSSSAGESGVALGAAQNWLRHSADPDPARLAGRLPRRQRDWATQQWSASLVLLRRGDGALERTPASHPLSFDTCATAAAAAGTPQADLQRRVP